MWDVGTIGGYGGDWFGSRDELLAIKRELLAREGVELTARSLSGRGRRDASSVETDTSPG